MGRCYLPQHFAGRYGLYQMDEIVHGGARVGVSFDCGLLTNQQAMVSLAIVAPELGEPGREVELILGEAPNTAKPGVEPHEQTRIRTTVAPCPFGAHARTDYRH